MQQLTPVLSQISYRTRQPMRGDVVIFNPPQEVSVRPQLRDCMSALR
jgi:hypothetical protein